MNKTLLLIIFVSCQTVSFLIMVVGATTPTNQLNNIGTDVTQLWAVSALLSGLSIFGWCRYFLKENKRSTGKKVLLSLVANIINILILLAPVLLVVFTLIMVIFGGVRV